MSLRLFLLIDSHNESFCVGIAITKGKVLLLQCCAPENQFKGHFSTLFCCKRQRPSTALPSCCRGRKGWGQGCAPKNFQVGELAEAAHWDCQTNHCHSLHQGQAQDLQNFCFHWCNTLQPNRNDHHVHCHNQSSCCQVEEPFGAAVGAKLDLLWKFQGNFASLPNHHCKCISMQLGQTHWVWSTLTCSMDLQANQDFLARLSLHFHVTQQASNVLSEFWVFRFATELTEFWVFRFATELSVLCVTLFIEWFRAHGGCCKIVGAKNPKNEKKFKSLPGVIEHSSRLLNLKFVTSGHSTGGTKTCVTNSKLAWPKMITSSPTVIEHSGRWLLNLKFVSWSDSSGIKKLFRWPPIARPNSLKPLFCGQWMPTIVFTEFKNNESLRNWLQHPQKPVLTSIMQVIFAHRNQG